MRGALLGVLGVDAALVAIGVFGYPAFLDQPGSIGYLVELAVLLIVYAGSVLAVTRLPSIDRRQTLRGAAIVGLALGVLEMVNISVETFTGLSGAANIATTAPLILGPFAVWAVVGGWAGRATGSLRAGLLAAVWTAMVTMLIGVTYGLLLALLAPNRLARNLANDPDFMRSGWTDIRAFVLANAFDNAFTHLVGALVVGSIVGLIGSAVGVRLSRSPVPTAS